MIDKTSKLNTRILTYLIVSLVLLFFSVVPATALIEDNGTGYSDPLANLPDGNRVKSLFQSMRDKTYTQGDRFPGFPSLYWSDIPDLMKIAESERMLQCYPVNTISSHRSQEGYPEGMIALWLIEGIRKGSRLPSLEGGGFPSLNPICFEYGKANTTQEIHRKAYDAYSKWWRVVKDLPKEEAVKVDPLKGTGLDWSGRTEPWQDEGEGVLRFRKSGASKTPSF